MIYKLLDDLKKEEGFRGYLYDDATGEPIVPGYTLKGHPTIWHGLCVERGRVPRLPEKLPGEVLERVVETIWYELTHKLPWLLAQPDDVQRAVCHMAYNMGVAGLLDFKLMLASLERGDRETAATNALASRWAKQVPHRAARVADLVRGFREGP